MQSTRRDFLIGSAVAPALRAATSDNNAVRVLPTPAMPPNVTTAGCPPIVTTGAGFIAPTWTLTVPAVEGAKPVPKTSIVSPALAAIVPGTADGSPTTLPFRFTAAANNCFRKYR
jgi:hypothetical protein